VESRIPRFARVRRARTKVANSINGLGSKLLIVSPGSTNSGGARSGSGGASTPSVADGLALAAARRHPSS